MNSGQKIIGFRVKIRTRFVGFQEKVNGDLAGDVA